jgi:hypothetical protein
MRAAKSLPFVIMIAAVANLAMGMRMYFSCT